VLPRLRFLKRRRNLEIRIILIQKTLLISIGIGLEAFKRGELVTYGSREKNINIKMSWRIYEFSRCYWS